MVAKPERVNEEVNKLLNDLLYEHDTSEVLVVFNDSLTATKFVTEFYTQNKFTVTWTDKGKLNNLGDTLFNIIENADAYGLLREDYYYSKLDSLLRSTKDPKTKKFDAVKLSEADLLFTDAFFKIIVQAKADLILIA
jgi:hypothetical protein